MELKMFDLILKNRGWSNDLFIQSDKIGYTEKELKEMLHLFGLSTSKDRETFFWGLEKMLEESILLHPYEQNGDLAEILAKSWNQENQPVIDKTMARLFIDRLSLRLDHRKHAFISLCQSDLEATFRYLNQDILPFAEWYVRFGLMLVDREMMLVDLAKVMFPVLFKGVDGKRAIFQAFDRLHFRESEGKLCFRGMKQYKRVTGLDRLPFAKGMADLLLSQFENTSDPLVDQFCKKISLYKKSLPSSSVIEDKVHYTTGLLTAVTAEPEVKKDNIHSSMKDQLDRVRQALNQLEETMILESESSAKQFVDKEIESLRKENERLQWQLDEMQKHQEQLMYRKLIELIQQLAGESSRYVLQELYEESTGRLEIEGLKSKGRLMRMFNALHMSGVEPYTYPQQQIGDVFTMEKEEIAQKYLIKDPIRTDELMVTVRLVGYGWNLHGKPIFLPVVEEMIT